MIPHSHGVFMSYQLLFSCLNHTVMWSSMQSFSNVIDLECCFAKSKACSLFLMNEVCMVFNFGGSFYQEASYIVLGLVLPMQTAVIVSYYVGISYDKLPQNPNLLPWRPTFLAHRCKADAVSVLLTMAVKHVEYWCLHISRNVSEKIRIWTDSLSFNETGF